MPEKNRFPAVLQPIMTVHGTQDPDTNTELAHTLGRNQGQENAVLAKYNSIKDHDQSVIFAANNWDELVQENAVLTQFGTEIAGTLTARHDSSPCADRGMNVLGYIDSGNGGLLPHEPMGTLVADSPSGGGRPLPACVYADLAVRRLTPVECDRLQGFPDNRTRIPLRKYSKKQVTKLRPDDMWELIDGEWWLMAADGPRYKAIGNSMAVPCMVWIGKRIALHLSEIGLPCADEEAA
ncbi:C-5 cytosine-specific DNA methylase [Aeromonas sp. RU39B]|nr:C-5 cytosine-specific DNA methylase [Aeromonas sp. RU39B]